MTVARPAPRGALFDRLRWPLLLAAAAGLPAAAWAFRHAGWSAVLRGVAAVGVPGFLLLCLISAVTFVPLGASWLVAARGEPLRRLGRFAGGRATREAANDMLPLAQIGGLVVGARTVLAGGAAPVPVYAGIIVDMSTELGAQIVFTVFALRIVADQLADTGGRLAPLLWVGMALATALAVSFFVLQRPALRLAAMLARKALPDLGDLTDEVRVELAATYACRGRVLLSFLLNLGAWAMTAMWSWGALRLMGVHVSIGHAAALESAIFALRSAAFVVPGALGVQEAGYALLAPLLLIDPAAALALSLLRRARDVALGVPTLLLWQAAELRAGRRAA